MKWNSALVLLLVISVAQAFATPVPRAERVLVAIEEGGAILLSAQTGQVLQTYKTGSNAFGALFSVDGRRAFVTDKDKGTLSEISLTDNSVLETIVVGTQPQQPAVTSDGRLYIPMSGEASVAVVDTSRGLKLLRKIPTGTGTKPHIVSLAPDEKLLWVTVQGNDPKVMAIVIAGNGEKLAKEFRYDIVPRVVAASNGAAYFTGHHSTGLHLAVAATGIVSTPYLDVNGPFSEAAKQIEGVTVLPEGHLIGLTHEGRKALITLDTAKKSPKKACDIEPLADKPYWVSLDSSGDVAYVSIPGKGLVEAYDITMCSRTPLWSTKIGGKAKRMAITNTP